MITDLINKWEEGNLSLENVLIEMEQLRFQFEQQLDALKNFKYDRSDDIETLSKEYREGYNGYIFEVRAGRITYDFKNIDEWKQYDQMKRDCESRYKQAYLAKQKSFMIASEDGEELQMPEVSYGKPSVIVKEIKK